ncbi:MAG: hypothetical protein IPG59_12025 [Candidatus Melainabacteria bacterium]|nr:MAG: hypothetical protein IPG59_12025 [Candidatus Melainabacteria bacterium]
MTLKEVKDLLRQTQKSLKFLWITFVVSTFASLAGMLVSVVHVAHGFTPYVEPQYWWMTYGLALIIDASIIAGKFGKVAFSISAPLEERALQRKESLSDAGFVFWSGFLVSTYLNAWSFYKAAIASGESPIFGALLGIGLMVLILKTASLAASSLKELMDATDIIEDNASQESPVKLPEVKAEAVEPKADVRQPAALPEIVGAKGNGSGGRRPNSQGRARQG